MSRQFVLILFSVILIYSCDEGRIFNRISIYNSLSIEIPKDWSDRDSSPISIKYHNLNFDTIIFNRQAESYMEVRVYDNSRNYYNNKGIFERLEYLENLMFYHTDSFSLLKTQTVNKGDILLNVIEFTFFNSENIKCYGSSVVFRTDMNHNYELCIYSLKTKDEAFQKMVRRMINSITIKS